MSSINGGLAAATDVGTLSQAIYNASQTRQTIATLTTETSTGLISSTYAGLGAGAATALNLSRQLAQNTTAQSNADTASSKLQVTQTALGQIQGIVTKFASELLGAAPGADSGLGSLATDATSALTQVANLLNTKIGDTYVFAGQDSRTPPVPDPSNITQSAFYTAIQTALSGLSGSGAATVQSQIIGIASPGGTSPFSPTLEASNQTGTVDLGNGNTVSIGVLADQNATAISAGTGTTSTGSYIRDTLAALSTVAGLGTADISDPQVQALLQGTLTTLNGANTAITTDIDSVGITQNTVTDAKTELGNVATALTTQLGNVQDADPATVATQLSEAQTRLQASYQVIASVGQLSLVKFLPV